jgi:hypothetical protein
MSTTSPATSCRCVANESAVEHNNCGNRRLVERRDTRLEPHAAHVHVTLREAIAGHSRVRRNRAAAGRSHIHHQRQRGAGAAHLRQSSGEGCRGIHLSHARVDEMRACCFEQPARFLR